MQNLSRVSLILAIILLACTPRANAQTSANARPTISDLLAPIRVENELPAIAAAIFNSQGMIESGVVGVRNIDDPTAATIDDLWHLGSCTKAMTATMIATLVDEGKLDWTTTLAEVFPGEAPAMDPACRGITLEQLLTHRSGLPVNGAWRQLGKNRTTTDQRLELLRRVTAPSPTSEPGSEYVYSNVGFAIAGLMAETVTGTPWETLMRDRVFTPLRMTDVGFGVAGTIGKIDQPWGHYRSLLGLGPLEPLQLDNAPSLGPAGTIHASLASWANFCALHLRPKNDLVTQTTWQRLHTPPDGGAYAMGWNVFEREWAGGKSLNHAGSNTINFCVCWLAPERDFGVLVATNAFQTNAPVALDKVASLLIDRVLAERD